MPELSGLQTGSLRLRSLDVLRGITIAGMILVNSAGIPDHTFAQLQHAKWDHPTATDVIFPCFLVIVGMSLSLSLTSRLERGLSRSVLAFQAGRRAVLLVLLGLLVNGFWLWIQGSWRLPGILQRIGICYAVAAPLYLGVSGARWTQHRRTVTLISSAAGLLILYGALLKYYPVPSFGAGHLDPYRNVAAVVDRHVLTPARMFQYGLLGPNGVIAFDPEGLLSTLGALASMLLGTVAGDILTTQSSRAEKCAYLAISGTGLWVAGLLLNPFLPLNKALYTPSFAFWSTGLSLLAFSGLFWLIDVKSIHRGWTLALIFGTNAILAFFLSQIVTGLLVIWRNPQSHLHMYQVLTNRVFTPWLSLRLASLSWAFTVVLFTAALVYPLFRKKIFLRL